VDEEIEAPTDSLEGMVEEEEDSNLGDGLLTTKCPKGGDGGGTVTVQS